MKLLLILTAVLLLIAGVSCSDVEPSRADSRALKEYRESGLRQTPVPDTSWRSTYSGPAPTLSEKEVQALIRKHFSDMVVELPDFMPGKTLDREVNYWWAKWCFDWDGEREDTTALFDDTPGWRVVLKESNIAEGEYVWGFGLNETTGEVTVLKDRVLSYSCSD